MSIKEMSLSELPADETVGSKKEQELKILFDNSEEAWKVYGLLGEMGVAVTLLNKSENVHILSVYLVSPTENLIAEAEKE